MKVKSRIVGVHTDRKWSFGARLHVSCAFAGDEFTFVVRDNAKNRSAYALGREVTIEVRLGR